MRIVPFLHGETDDKAISLSRPDGSPLTLRKQPNTIPGSLPTATKQAEKPPDSVSLLTGLHSPSCVQPQAGVNVTS